MLIILCYLLLFLKTSVIGKYRKLFILPHLIKCVSIQMCEMVKLKGGIYEVKFEYTTLSAKQLNMGVQHACSTL